MEWIGNLLPYGVIYPLWCWCASATEALTEFALLMGETQWVGVSFNNLERNYQDGWIKGA
jgi:hypothetical protein